MSERNSGVCGGKRQRWIVNTKVLLIGKVFNQLTVVGPAFRSGKRSVRMVCRCTCGVYVAPKVCHVKGGHITHCGMCKVADPWLISGGDQWVGKSFGKVTIIGPSFRAGGCGSKVVAQCDCGEHLVASTRHFRKPAGKQRSCSYRCKHGMWLCSPEVSLKTGSVFGRWTVVGPQFRGSQQRAFMVCRCSCGTHRVVSRIGLTTGRSSSCGCSALPWVSDTAQDYAGVSCGKLTVIGPMFRIAKAVPRVVCECECGGYTIIDPELVKNQKVKSCGCASHTGDASRKSQQDFLDESRIAQKQFPWEYSQAVYAGYNNLVTIGCPKHGWFTQTAGSHLQGHGCPRCAVNYQPTPDEFRVICTSVHGDDWDHTDTVYVNNKTHVTVACDLHGPFQVLPSNHIHQLNGCPRCKASRGERRMRRWLQRHGVVFEEQKRFKDCRYKNPLPFDFCVQSENLLAEYDGESHEFPVKHFGGIPNFIRTRHRDGIKTRWASENGYELLRISYRDMDRIPEILSERLLSGSVQMRLFAG